MPRPQRSLPLVTQYFSIDAMFRTYFSSVPSAGTHALGEQGPESPEFGTTPGAWQVFHKYLLNKSRLQISLLNKMIILLSFQNNLGFFHFLVDVYREKDSSIIMQGHFPLMLHDIGFAFVSPNWLHSICYII